MNIFDLDQLGERLVDLDDNQELYNCTAQLVIAANRLLREFGGTPPFHALQCDCALCDMALRLRPFTKGLDGPTVRLVKKLIGEE